MGEQAVEQGSSGGQMLMLRLAARDDAAVLAKTYRENGHVRIQDLLVAEDADFLGSDLESRTDWWKLINTPDGILELDRGALARMSAKRRAALDMLVHERARRGFQYRYEALRVPDLETDIASTGDPLAAFARLMRSKPMLDLLTAIVGERELGFVDGQATAYGPGDFLTVHDDDVPGRNRRAAMVLGLTRDWRPDWGGLLLFPQAGSGVLGCSPDFNTLDLFAVPQVHSVSMVTPAAPHRRLAITGWLSRP